MESDKQPQTDEVRELVPNEAGDLSEAFAGWVVAKEGQEAGHRELPQCLCSEERDRRPQHLYLILQRVPRAQDLKFRY